MRGTFFYQTPDGTLIHVTSSVQILFDAFLELEAESEVSCSIEQLQSIVTLAALCGADCADELGALLQEAQFHKERTAFWLTHSMRDYRILVPPSFGLPTGSIIGHRHVYGSNGACLMPSCQHQKSWAEPEISDANLCAHCRLMLVLATRNAEDLELVQERAGQLIVRDKHTQERLMYLSRITLVCLCTDRD